MLFGVGAGLEAGAAGLQTGAAGFGTGFGPGVLPVGDAGGATGAAGTVLAGFPPGDESVGAAPVSGASRASFELGCEGGADGTTGGAPAGTDGKKTAPGDVDGSDAPPAARTVSVFVFVFVSVTEEDEDEAGVKATGTALSPVRVSDL